MDDLYQEQIVDHYQNPRNFGELSNADVTVRESNASCGDLVELMIKLDDSKTKIVDISFRGVGCAMSVASASLLTEKIKDEHMPLAEASDLDIVKMKDILGIDITPTRSKCVLLVVRALRKALDEIS